jgi:hypothetical protein
MTHARQEHKDVRRHERRPGATATYASRRPTPVARLSSLVRTSTLVLALGVLLFVLPLPGTFIAGGLVLLAGGLARWLGV